MISFTSKPRARTFLSTPSARRATLLTVTVQNVPGISIHALREEGDPTTIKMTASHSGFLSTPSARRATHENALAWSGYGISIHALREEGDGNTYFFRSC